MSTDQQMVIGVDNTKILRLIGNTSMDSLYTDINDVNKFKSQWEPMPSCHSRSNVSC